MPWDSTHIGTVTTTGIAPAGATKCCGVGCAAGINHGWDRNNIVIANRVTKPFAALADNALGTYIVGGTPR